MYNYYHRSGQEKDLHGELLGGVAEPRTLGVHRAWSDGSVVWTPGAMLDFDPARRNETAAFASGPEGRRYGYDWF
jgi:hypothetical protein